MNPPANSAEPPPEDRALVRGSLGWLLAGLGLTVVSAAAFTFLGDRRVPRAVGMLIALGFPAAAFSSAVGAWLFYRKVAGRTRKELPDWAHALARTGVLIAAGISIVIVLLTFFAAVSIK